MMNVKYVEDLSIYWSIKPWGDGSYWLENLGNGSAYHLEKWPTGLMSMSSNITKPQSGQSFVFATLGKINNNAYSTLTVCL